jgi:hypothetical protein
MLVGSPRRQPRRLEGNEQLQEAKKIWIRENGGNPNGKAGERGEDEFPSRAVEAVWG